MRLWFKVGTMSAKHYDVYRKRKPPKVGDFFKIREPGERYARLEGVHLLEIRYVNGQELYVVERF